MHVSEFIHKSKPQFEAKFVGVGMKSPFENEKDWRHFIWNITLNGQEFPFYTGEAHAIRRVGNVSRKNEVIFSWEKWGENVFYTPTPPTLSGFLETVQTDLAVSVLSFEEFCSEFGYSTDSKSAEKTYHGAQDVARKYARAMGFDAIGILIQSVNFD